MSISPGAGLARLGQHGYEADDPSVLLRHRHEHLFVAAGGANVTFLAGGPVRVDPRVEFWAQHRRHRRVDRRPRSQRQGCYLIDVVLLQRANRHRHAAEAREQPRSLSTDFKTPYPIADVAAPTARRDDRRDGAVTARLEGAVSGLAWPPAPPRSPGPPRASGPAVPASRPVRPPLPPRDGPPHRYCRPATRTTPPPAHASVEVGRRRAGGGDIRSGTGVDAPVWTARGSRHLAPTRQPLSTCLRPSGTPARDRPFRSRGQPGRRPGPQRRAGPRREPVHQQHPSPGPA